MSCSDCPFASGSNIILSLSTVSAFELTTATCNAQTFGKIVFVKPDWGNLMRQWNSGDRAATSVVSALSGLITFKPSRTVLVVSPSLKHGVLGPLEAWILLEFATVLLVGMRVPLDFGSALRHSRFSCQNNSPLVVLDVHLEVEAHLLPSITSLTVTLPQFLQTKL